MILVGVQGSGKTSFYRERFFHSHVRISLDMLRTRRREQILVAACLQALQPFVVDNTNGLIEERATYLGSARPARFRSVGYYFECSLGEALGRNRGRPGRARIPDVGVVRTFRRLQPPTLEEGFDELFTVRLEGGAFLVTPRLPAVP